VSGPSDPELTAMITGHRRQLTDLLAALPASAWDQPSLCAGWRVREVAAHILMTLRTPAWRFAAEMARSGGNFNRMADRVARRDGAAAPAELVAALREHGDTIFQPPGGGVGAGLTHDVVHGLDMTVALGVEHPVPEPTLRAVLDTVNGTQSRKHFGVNLDGIRLQADDIDWSCGSGQVVSGSAQDLALVACGRRLPAGRLQGGASARFA
jgi:uncharacterized protein (TIGR03083 family)